MLLKAIDDKAPRLRMLEQLGKATNLPSNQRKWVRDELARARKGIEGEREAAHYLDNYFKDGQNHAVLHDLRFVVDGDTAQIDHMVINRMGFIYLIETKNYAGNLLINEQGEFTVEYDSDKFGIPSPIEQSQRHERILVKLIDRLGLGARLGGLEYHHVVLLHPKATITRPPAKAFDTSMVIKADQFPTWHKKFVDKTVGLGAIVKGLLNVRSMDTIVDWGEKLIRQHQPADLLTLPAFIRAMPEQPVVAETPPPQPVTPKLVEVPTAIPPKPADTPAGTLIHPLAKKLVCVTCSTKITYAEGKFCWNNSKRFGGLQYCRDHQGGFSN